MNKITVLHPIKEKHFAMELTPEPIKEDDVELEKAIKLAHKEASKPLATIGDVLDKVISQQPIRPFDE